MFNSNNRNAGMNMAQQNNQHQKLDGSGKPKFNKDEIQAKVKDHF